MFENLKDLTPDQKNLIAKVSDGEEMSTKVMGVTGIVVAGVGAYLLTQLRENLAKDDTLGTAITGSVVTAFGVLALVAALYFVSGAKQARATLERDMKNDQIDKAVVEHRENIAQQESAFRANTPHSYWPLLD